MMNGGRGTVSSTQPSGTIESPAPHFMTSSQPLYSNISSRAPLHPENGRESASASSHDNYRLDDRGSLLRSHSQVTEEGEAGHELERLRVSLNMASVSMETINPTPSLPTPTLNPPSSPRQRPQTVQTTLTGSLLPPLPSPSPSRLPQPQLPNLAQEALLRLADEAATRNGDDSIEDFRPLKKRKLCQEIEVDPDDEDEGQTCSICFEPWSNSGSHRIASLKCGHLFGLHCIEKWVKGQGGNKCPQCNAKAKRNDIRVIFAKSVKVLDTTDRDRAIQEKEEEKALRIGAQKAEAQAVLQCQLARAECDRLKEQLKILRQELEDYKTRVIPSTDCPTSSSSTTQKGTSVRISGQAGCDDGRYVLWKTIPVSPDGGARVLAYNPSLGILVASKPSANHILPGCGLMKYNTMDMSHGQYISAHSGVIRDAVFSPHGDNLLLTGSMDKTCRLTSLHSNSNVLTYKTPSPVWACAWNVDDPNYVYAGLNGSVCVFDVRNTSGGVASLQTEGDRAPVTSLSYVPLCSLSTFNASGLLAGSLNGGVFWQRDIHQLTFTPHPLSTIPGNCTSLSFEPTTRHCMASFRPSKRVPGTHHSTHILCQLCNVPQDQPLSCRPIHQFVGGTSHRLLSRSRLFQRPGEDCSSILAAFGIEEHTSVSIWNASTMSRLQTLSLAQGPALDIAPFSCGERDFLAVLSETTLSLFQWQTTPIMN